MHILSGFIVMCIGENIEIMLIKMDSMEEVRKEFDEKIRILKEEFEKKINEFETKQDVIYKKCDFFRDYNTKKSISNNITLANKYALKYQDDNLFTIFFRVMNHDTFVIQDTEFKANKRNLDDNCIESHNYFKIYFPMNHKNFLTIFRDNYIPSNNSNAIFLTELNNCFITDDGKTKKYRIHDLDLKKYKIELDIDALHLLRKYSELLF